MKKLLLIALIFMSCKDHPSEHYEYYDDLSQAWVPITKDKLMFRDTTIIAYQMAHTTAGLYSYWWITEDGLQIDYNSEIIVITLEKLPNFRKGERLTQFQIENAYRK